jgi:hypothetical protein
VTAEAEAAAAAAAAAASTAASVISFVPSESHCQQRCNYSQSALQQQKHQ